MEMTLFCDNFGLLKRQVLVDVLWTVINCFIAH